jgi:DNA repair protein RadC
VTYPDVQEAPAAGFTPPLPLSQTEAEARSRRRWLEDRVLRPDDVSLDDLEALALLCGLDERRAQTLLEAFGSLPEVIGAPAAELARVAGRRAAVRVRLVQLLARRQLERSLRDRPVISASSQLHAYLRATLTGAPREQFRVLFLDKKNRLIADERLGDGTVDHAPVYPREVMRRALELNASAVILAHNHPGGDPTPSAADIDITKQVVEAGRALRVAVHDHVIVGGQAAASLRTLGLLT